MIAAVWETNSSIFRVWVRPLGFCRSSKRTTSTANLVEMPLLVQAKVLRTSWQREDCSRDSKRFQTLHPRWEWPFLFHFISGSEKKGQREIQPLHNCLRSWILPSSSMPWRRKPKTSPPHQPLLDWGKRNMPGNLIRKTWSPCMSQKEGLWEKCSMQSPARREERLQKRWHYRFCSTSGARNAPPSKRSLGWFWDRVDAQWKYVSFWIVRRMRKKNENEWEWKRRMKKKIEKEEWERRMRKKKEERRVRRKKSEKKRKKKERKKKGKEIQTKSNQNRPSKGWTLSP